MHNPSHMNARDRPHASRALRMPPGVAGGRAGRNLVVAVLVVTAACLVAGTVLVIASQPLPAKLNEWGFTGFQAAGAITFAAAGALIALRHPQNPIGWLLLLAGGLLSAIQFLIHYHVVHAIVTGVESDSLLQAATWLDAWIWVPIVGSVAIFAILLFPTGRLPSPRWRKIAWTALAGVVVTAISSMLTPLTDVAGVSVTEWPVLIIFTAAGFGVMSASLVASVASLVLRYRRASGTERQQLKWLALAAVGTGVGWLFYVVSLVATGSEATLSAVPALGFLLIPAAIGVAILRHRLLDIDLLINRALVYSLLSLLLALVYVVSVLALQALLGPLIAGGGTMAVAGSTLAVAALFRPARGRVQAAVDRRFYRSRYDAQLLLEGFGARLRDELDLDALSSALAAAARETLRPTAAAVWLRTVPGGGHGASAMTDPARRRI